MWVECAYGKDGTWGYPVRVATSSQMINSVFCWVLINALVKKNSLPANKMKEKNIINDKIYMKNYLAYIQCSTTQYGVVFGNQERNGVFGQPPPTVVVRRF